MTPADTLTSEVRPTQVVDGLEVEVFATEEEAAVAFAAVEFYLERQAAAFVTETAHLTSQQDD